MRGPWQEPLLNSYEKMSKKQRKRLLKVELIGSNIEKYIVVIVGMLALFGSLGFSNLGWKFAGITTAVSAAAGAGIGFFSGRYSKDSSRHDDE